MPARESLVTAIDSLSVTACPLTAREPPVSATGHSVSASWPPVKARATFTGPLMGHRTCEGPTEWLGGPCQVQRQHGRVMYAHSRPKWVRLGCPSAAMPNLRTIFPEGTIVKELLSYMYLTEGFT